MAKAAAKSTSMVKWDAELAKLAAGATETEAHVGGGSFIGTASGVLKFKGAEVPGNKMNVVVLDHIIENAFYPGNYDSNNPQPPVCFAFGRVEEGMAPHPDSAEPQHETCAGCPQNEYGTANTGKGKACKNIRRLALISQGDLDEDIAAAEVAYLKVPVTSVKAWAGFVRQGAEVLKRPPLGFVTEIGLVPDPKSQFKMNFRLIEPIADAETMGAIIEKNKLVAKEIDFPYSAPAEAVAPPPRRVGKKIVPPKRAAAAAGKTRSKF